MYRKKLFRMCAVLLLSALLTGTYADAHEQEALTENRLLEILEQHGNAVVLINFFASWCTPCRQEIPLLKMLRNRYPQTELFMIGVSVDTNMNALAAFEKSIQCTYPLYVAAPELISSLQLDAVPRTVILDRQQHPILNVTGILPKEVLLETVDSLLQKNTPEVH